MNNRVRSDLSFFFFNNTQPAKISAIFQPFVFFFFNETATTEIYTLSLPDALPIFPVRSDRRRLLGLQPDRTLRAARRLRLARRVPRPREGAAPCRPRGAARRRAAPLGRHGAAP